MGYHFCRLLRLRGTVLLACLFGASACSGTEEPPPQPAGDLVPGARGPSFVPRAGMIPDSLTAVRVAEAVLTPVYGLQEVEGQRPLVATLVDSVWIVHGTLPPDHVGGVARVELSQRDARVLRMIHGL